MKKADHTDVIIAIFEVTELEKEADMSAGWIIKCIF